MAKIDTSNWTEEQIKAFRLQERTTYEAVKKRFVPDKPRVFDNFEEALDNLKTMNRLVGANFTLLMEDEGLYKVYERQNQPCQGGEMRKYWSTHGDDCTRPFDHRPGDLKTPFPKGNPVAVAQDMYSYNTHIGEKKIEQHNNMIDAIYSSESPYLRGFGSPESVLKIKGDKEMYHRVIYTDTKVDSTLLVNSLQYKNSCNFDTFRRYIEYGFTTREALALPMLMNTNICESLNPDGSTRKIIIPGATGTYYFSGHASLRRIFEADANDLTGGTYYDRYDYNRPEVQDLFMASDDEIGLNFGTEFHKLYQETYGEPTAKRVPGTYNTEYTCTDERLVDTIKSLFNTYYYSNGGMKEQKLEAA